MSVARTSRLRNPVLLETGLEEDKTIHATSVKQRPPDSRTQEGLWWHSAYMRLMQGQVHGFPG